MNEKLSKIIVSPDTYTKLTFDSQTNSLKNDNEEFKIVDGLVVLLPNSKINNKEEQINE